MDKNNPNIFNGINYQSELRAKWSKAILDDGFTVIPNLLIKRMDDLGIESHHMTIILVIEMHRWRAGSAWPSQQKIADISGYSLRQVNRITTELSELDLVKKVYREGRSCLYDFSPLVKQLEEYLGISHKRPDSIEL